MYVQKDMVEDILEKLDQKFGKASLIITNRENILEYLNMIVDYRTEGMVTSVSLTTLIKC